MACIKVANSLTNTCIHFQIIYYCNVPERTSHHRAVIVSLASYTTVDCLYTICTMASRISPGASRAPTDHLIPCTWSVWVVLQRRPYRWSAVECTLRIEFFVQLSNRVNDSSITWNEVNLHKHGSTPHKFMCSLVGRAFNRGVQNTNLSNRIIASYLSCNTKKAN